MTVPYHSIHNSLLIMTQVFHSPYYEDEAQVKCSLSKSNGDSNRFLTSWRVYSLHKPHSLIKWATDHHNTLSRTKSQVRQAPPVPEDRFGDRGIQGILRLHAAPSSFSSTITNTTHGGSTPGPDSVQASRSERLILQAKCGACVQHDKKAVNDRSLIDTSRGTTVNTTIRPCPVSLSFPHLVTFLHSIDT